MEKTPANLRAIEDVRIVDALRTLKVPDAKGRPRPKIVYGRRKKWTAPGLMEGVDSLKG